MMLYIAFLILFIITILVVASIYFKKSLYVLIPLVFIGTYWLVFKTTDYMGYAIDENLVSGEAILASSYANEKYIYLTVYFSDEMEPRFVRILQNEENSKETQKAAQTISVIKFGKKIKGLGEGESTTSGEEATIEVVPLNESETFSKK